MTLADEDTNSIQGNVTVQVPQVGGHLVAKFATNASAAKLMESISGSVDGLLMLIKMSLSEALGTLWCGVSVFSWHAVSTVC